MIERFHIQNFRCLESLTLDFAGKSSILVIGKNGSGKSAVRFALAIIQEFVVDRVASPRRFYQVTSPSTESLSPCGSNWN